ncbi:DUF808 domain-containing protein [Aureibaculum algae]|uniref:DUF808 domain-containing protein n=1 Tax=Aureibaculum algae TaxID=2584122 RepID=A0A5B7TST3_9FLAO|nr:DUF808 domain-containing protein [Aureibaculum algae]QCX38264.1 DUF808 domain-containing protein [Aureibaculum algae]
MATGFFALLDDIAALMDDVAVMGKIATKKTAGILGDDLAVNAEKASGFISSREIPVLWAITKGSFLNKLIILPIAFLLSAFLPWAVTLILILGGVYLAYEGAEKIYELIVPHHHETVIVEETELTKEEVLALEKTKIRSAIITDFILSIEIVIIALGTVLDKPLLTQIMVVSVVAIIATIGVYGIVALIVRMDDLGVRFIKLSKDKKNISYYIGTFLIKALPMVIRALGIIGTIALLLVAGGIFVHYIDFFHHVSEDLLSSVPSILKEFIFGLVIGFVALFVLNSFKFIWKKIKK